MIDVGLLASILAAAAAPWLLARFLPASRGRPAVDGDALMMAALAGLIAGRLAFVALEDPASFSRFGDLLIIRSGVEFWPGLAAGVMALCMHARRGNVSLWGTLAVAAPLFLVGYGAYEASCTFREGCFGPPSPIGLAPVGFARAVFPVGWVVAAVSMGAGVAIRRSDTPDVRVVLSALLTVAASRAVAGFFLPRVGSDLTRPHLESLSLVAFALAAQLGVGALGRHTTSSRTTPVRTPPTDPDPRKGP